jgi:hypothetical protein
MPPAAHDTDERVRARAVDHGDIPLFWALGAAADAWPEMVRALSSWRSPIFFEALGWFGHAEAIPLLLEALRREDEAEKEAASWALFRLTGAPLSDDDAPDKLVPLPAELRWGSTFRPPERPGLLTKEPAIWAAWWKANQAGISPTVRYRFGHAWSPADNLWELEDLQTPTADREPAYLELVLRTGAASVPLDRDDFVAQQRVQMTALRAHCDRSAVRPGEYALRFVR